MRALLFSFVLLIVGALIFGYQDQEMRILIFGLLFGAMIGAMCAFSVGWQRGQAAEQRAQAQRNGRRGVGRMRTVEA